MAFHQVQPRHRGHLANRIPAAAPEVPTGPPKDNTDPADPDNGNNNGNNNGNGNNNNNNNNNNGSSHTTTTTTKKTTTTSKSDPTPDANKKTTSKEDAERTTSSSSSSTRSSSTSSSSSTSALPTSSPGITISTGPAVTLQPTFFPSVTRSLGTTLDVQATASATSSAAPSGSLNTGVLIGGIAGGIGGIIVIALLIGFVLRRSRRRRETYDDFDPADFRKSGVMLDDGNSEFFSARPPTMLETRHAVAPSISSTNMAGMGSNYSAQVEAAAGYLDMHRETPASAPAPAAPGALGPGQIREREKYTFGQAPIHDDSVAYGHYDAGGSNHGHDDGQSQYQFYADQAGSQYDQHQQHQQPARASMGDVDPYGGM